MGGIEHFFGQGIQSCRAEASPFGQPVQKLDLGCAAPQTTHTCHSLTPPAPGCSNLGGWWHNVVWLLAGQLGIPNENFSRVNLLWSGQPWRWLPSQSCMSLIICLEVPSTGSSHALQGVAMARPLTNAVMLYNIGLHVLRAAATAAVLRAYAIALSRKLLYRHQHSLDQHSLDSTPWISPVQA